jgi:preprotein translocase subunit SecA
MARRRHKRTHGPSVLHDQTLTTLNGLELIRRSVRAGSHGVALLSGAKHVAKRRIDNQLPRRAGKRNGAVGRSMQPENCKLT